MANPYHDADGKFCSRNGMKNAIDNAALEGDVSTYIRLRQEFEDIDKVNVVIIDSEEYKKLTVKGRFEGLPDSAIVEAIKVEVYKPNPDFKVVEEAVKTTKYSDDALYQSLRLGNLTSTERIKLIKDSGDPNYWSYPLADMNVADDMVKNHYPEMMDGLRSMPTNMNTARSVAQLVNHLGSVAETQDDINYLIHRTPWFSGSFSNETNLLANPNVDRETAIRILDKCLVNGGINYGYYQETLITRLRSSGQPVPYRSRVWNNSPTPLPDGVNSYALQEYENLRDEPFPGLEMSSGVSNLDRAVKILKNSEATAYEKLTAVVNQQRKVTRHSQEMDDHYDVQTFLNDRGEHLAFITFLRKLDF